MGLPVVMNASGVVWMNGKRYATLGAAVKAAKKSASPSTWLAWLKVAAAAVGLLSQLLKLWKGEGVKAKRSSARATSAKRSSTGKSKRKRSRSRG